MALYMKCSTEIYNIYLKYVAPEDIHVYSIDEVFMDVTHYLNTYQMTARELAAERLFGMYPAGDVGLQQRPESERICTCVKLPWILWRSISSRMQNGVRIAELDRNVLSGELLWDHQSADGFLACGPGVCEEACGSGRIVYDGRYRKMFSWRKPGIYYNEDLLYRLFGMNAELLIDHAWGYEPCTIADVKAYQAGK